MQQTIRRRLALLTALTALVLTFLPPLVLDTTGAMTPTNSTSAVADNQRLQQPCPDTLAYKSCLGLMPPAYGMGAYVPSVQVASGAPNIPFLHPAVSTPTGSWPHVLTTVDLAQSGRARAAVATDRYFDEANDRQLHLFDMQSGSFARTQQVLGGANPEAAVTMDADLNGQPDIVVALSGDNALAIYHPGVTQPLSDAVRLPVGGGPNALAVGDFDGDLRADLAAVTPLSDTIRFWRSSPGGLTPLSLKLPHSTDGFDALAVGDFNSDGQDDLASLRGAGYAKDSVVIYLQNRSTFPVSYTLSPETGGFLPNSLTVGDINSDGRDDLVVTAGGNTPSAYLNVFVQEVQDAAAVPVTYRLAVAPKTTPAYHLPSAVAIGDLNHDGRDDVAVLNDAWRTLSVYTQTLTTDLSPYAAADIPYSSRYRPNALALSDFDGNGGLDAALVGRDAGLTVLTNTLTAPRAAIVTPVDGARVSAGSLLVTGTVGIDATAVEVRVKGLTNWIPTTLAGGVWQAVLELPGDLRASWWIEARAVAGDRYQAPPARHRVRAETVCFAVADNGGIPGSPDRLMRLNTLTAEAKQIGATRTDNIHALAFKPGTPELYTADDRRLGTLSLATGVFTALPQRLGVGQGAQGTITFGTLTGLAFHPVTGELYAVNHRSGQGNKDVLLKIDAITGERIVNAFGSGQDYVQIIGDGVLNDVDDVAFDPLTNTLYGIVNNNGVGGMLVQIDATTGATQVVGDLGVDNMEGLSFSSDGRLFGTSGISYASTRNRLWQIDKATGKATLINRISSQQDYESLACVPSGVALLPPVVPAARVENFTVREGAAHTSTPNITLSATTVGGESQKLVVREYAYQQAAAQWVDSRTTANTVTSASDAGATETNISWQLSATAGVKYLQAWVTDNSDGTSSLSQQTMINYIPDRSAVAAGQGHIYRYALTRGEQLTVHMESLKGDADVYVWSENPDTAAWVSNGREPTDEVQFTAPANGLYQVEVRGATDAEYRLVVTVGSQSPLIQSVMTATVDSSKEIPAQPLVPLDSTPNWDAQSTNSQVYLPLMQR